MFGRSATAVSEAPAELEAQLATFFADHYDRLVRLAALVCHATSATEDAVQAAMEQAWRRRHTLLDPNRIKPWLDQIVVREAIRLNRKPWWARLARATDDEMHDVRDRAPGPSADILALRQGLARLPVEQRAAIALHLWAGYSVEETSELMGAPVGTTRSRLRLARQRLRQELSEEGR